MKLFTKIIFERIAVL